MLPLKCQEHLRSFHVLLLGEGNFSFTSALVRLIQQSQWEPIALYLQCQVTDLLAMDRVHFLATSFDTRSQVVEKYPESEAILHRLAQLGSQGMGGEEGVAVHVQVRHAVNAWQLRDCFGPESTNPLPAFHCILWNHPHLGTEDLRLHRFLLAHFFQSARSVLAVANYQPNPPPSQVILTLVEGQESRWQLNDQAARSNLFPRSMPSDFLEAQFPGYQCKRNKNGQSFKNEATRKSRHSRMPSFVHRFIYQDKDPATLDGALDSALTALNATNLRAVGAALSESAMIASSGSKCIVYSPDLLLEQRRLKRTTHPAPNSGPASSVKYRCPDCPTVLETLRAISQHHRQVHLLNQFPVESETCNIHCLHCDRQFRRLVDQEQHMIGRHSVLTSRDLQLLGRRHDINYQTGLFSKCEKDEDETQSVYDYVPCPVCGQAVMNTPDSDAGMVLHLEMLKPVLGLRMQCPLHMKSSSNCREKLFTEQRALEQHFLRCRLRIQSDCPR